MQDAKIFASIYKRETDIYILYVCIEKEKQREKKNKGMQLQEHGNKIDIYMCASQ